MRNVKLTRTMVNTLRNVETLEDGRMALPVGTGVSTAVALKARGICLGANNRSKRNFLTRQGVSAWVTASRDESWNGCKVVVSDDGEGMEEFTPDAPKEPETATLTVDSLTPNGRATYAYYANNGMNDATALRKAADMCGIVEKDAVSVSPMPSVPDMSAVPAECYWACSNPVTGAFCDYVGRTEGVCDEHTDRVSTPITTIARAEYENEIAAQWADVDAGDAHYESYDAESLSVEKSVSSGVVHTNTRECVICPTLDTRFMSSEEKAKAFACVESAQAKQDAESLEMINAPESDWMYRANGLTEEKLSQDEINSVIADFRANGDHSECLTDSLTGQCIHDNFNAVIDAPKVPTVNVVQAHMGMTGVNHYHAPGCRDIQREMTRWNAQPGMGVYEFPFASAAEILSFEYSDVENGDWVDMVIHANDSFDGVRIMPCLSIPMGMADLQELAIKKGKFELVNVLESERCILCDTHGDVSMPGKSIEGDYWACGYCLANSRTLDNLNSHALSVYVETENAGIKNECAWCGSIMTRGMFAEIECSREMVGPWIDPNCGCERHANPSEVPCPDHSDTITYPRINERGETVWACCESSIGAPCGHLATEDGGFVETMVTKEYRLSVMVDERTGATVDLGWVTLTMNAAQADDYDRVAEAYGAAHGKGTPRHGWASIIVVHDVADL